MTVTVIRHAVAPEVIEPERFRQVCACGRTYSGGKPDPRLLAAWMAAHQRCEDGQAK